MPGEGAEIVEKGREIGIAAIDLIPAGRYAACFNVADEQGGLAGTGRAVDPDCLMRSAGVEPGEQLGAGKLGWDARYGRN